MGASFTGDLPLRQEIVLVTPPSTRAAGVRVYFIPSRSTVVACKVSGLKPRPTSLWVQLTALGIDLRWSPGVEPGTRVKLTVEFRGEPLVVARAVFRRRGGAAAAPEHSAKSSATIQPSEPALQDFETFARSFVKARGEAIHASATPAVREYGPFLNHLDDHTNAALIIYTDVPIAVATVRSAIVRVMELKLVDRVMARRRWELKHPGTPATGLPASPLEQVQHISQVLLEIYRHHLSVDGALDPGRAWEAFTQFANGELRVEGAGEEKWNGEPNSAQLFCFAEFAFMAIERGVEPGVWEGLLPALVAMQPIFMRTYRPPQGKPLRFDAYEPANFSVDRQFKPEEKEALRERFTAMSLDELKVAAAAHARDAFASH